MSIFTQNYCFCQICVWKLRKLVRLSKLLTKDWKTKGIAIDISIFTCYTDFILLCDSNKLHIEISWEVWVLYNHGSRKRCLLRSNKQKGVHFSDVHETHSKRQWLKSIIFDIKTFHARKRNSRCLWFNLETSCLLPGLVLYLEVFR